MKKAFIVFPFLLIFIAALAATFTSTTNGSWSAGATWGGTAPANNGSHTVTMAHNITAPSSLQGFTSITLNSGKTFTSGSVGTPQSLTLNQITTFTMNGNMTVYGDLTVTNSTTFNLTSGSTLTIIGGSLIIGSGATVNVASGATVTAAGFSSGNNSDAILNNSGTITIGTTAVNGTASPGGPVNNLSGGIFKVNGALNMSSSNTAIFTNSGNLNVTGAVMIPGSAKLKTNPGGYTLVGGNVTTSGNENLVVGTAVAPPAYADMIIQGNLISESSGDVKIDKNGRFGLVGNFSSTSNGGILFTIENGGQAYINGNISLTGGGGNTIDNKNTVDPYGLYINGTTTGAAVDSNVGNKTTLQTTNPVFYAWLAAQPGFGAMPITLLYFKNSGTTDQGIALVWATSYEKDFDHFQLERAGKDLKFNAISMIEGKGGLKVTTVYDYLDGAPANGKNYYRLKSVDVDGSYEYSNLIMVQWETSESISLYPNPIVNKSFTIQLGQDLTDVVAMSIIDNTGRIILQSELNGSSTFFQLPENIENGHYVVRVSSGSGQKMIHILIH